MRASAVLAALGGTGAATILAAPAAVAGEYAVRVASYAGTDPDLHLLRRATFGVTKQQARQIKSIGAQAWLDRQLDPAAIDDSAMDALLADRFPGLSWSIAGALGNLEDFSWDLMFDLGVATLARACWSKRQLFEVMVDFWSNHLNVANPSDSVWATRHDYDRNVIRKHALGKFSDMLVASATHPAMMTYLNNAESSKDNPNQNYGRELLELHSVSLGADYTYEDMLNSVNVMTGFGINWDTYEFEYHKWDHYTGPVQVLGFSSPNGTGAGGYQVGLNFVNYLARHPSTAASIAEKLARRFVSDTPPSSLVTKLAQTYLANDTAVLPMLRQLFASPEFAAAIGQKIRRPMESVVATVRTLGMKADLSGTDGMQGLYWMVEELGQAPLAWGPPNGYPDFADAWRSAGGTLGRWNSNIDLAAHWWPDELVLPPLRNLFPATLPATYAGYVNTLASRLVYRKLDPAHRDAVLAFVGRQATDPLRATDAAMKWRLPYVVSLILDSPYHQVR